MRVTREDVIALIMMLPDDKLVTVYDFVSYVQFRASKLAAEEQRIAHELFGDVTEEQLRAEEELWDRTFAATREKLHTLAEQVGEAYRTGNTTGIDDSGDELKPTP